MRPDELIMAQVRNIFSRYEYRKIQLDKLKVQCGYAGGSIFPHDQRDATAKLKLRIYLPTGRKIGEFYEYEYNTVEYH